MQRLISEKNNTPDNSSPVKETAETTAPSDNTAHPPHFSKVTIPPAHEIWNLTDTECKSILNSAGVESHAPTFATPFVRTPLLLDSPIEGVVIDSKWPTESFRRVMDCRLMVTLIQLARRARERGVVKIEYYSTWRPIKSITQCAAGQKGDKCRKVYERAQNGKLPSQHSRATAIDIRWFTFENGSTVDVLNHFEMNFHEPPCDDLPITEEGRFLQEFACILHQDKAFNVMLTPNADRDHENHFHFDITPNVKWYIIR
ncbi:MAG: extensin family protein [Deltaproteobacteria bacterium]|nr:extensin family protein [Deltaproteobacteria bacterium]